MSNRLDYSTRQSAHDLLALRQQHPAWLILAARRGPLMLACIKSLLHSHANGIPWEDAVRHLAQAFAQFAYQDDLGINTEENDDFAALARKELREWIVRKLFVERSDLLLPTDALQQALQFAEGLQTRFMTSTASRLATVQRAIDDLEVRLNPDAVHRTTHLQARIDTLQAELEDVKAGKLQVLDGERAHESVREVYQLAMSLRADIRRVEDSYRQADRVLRQRIVSEQQHRGDVLDQLLDSHDRLLDTTEGQVFEAFHAQLSQGLPLDAMARGLRSILGQAPAKQGLTAQQRSDLRWLVVRLVRESRGVIEARARSERDVRSFMQTGLAAEHHRVGQLVQQVLDAALHIDWQPQATRRLPLPVPPLAAALAQGQHALRPIDRWVYSMPGEDGSEVLDLTPLAASLDDIDDSFWDAFDSLDEALLTQQTRTVLRDHPEGLGLAALATLLPPTHDLQTLTFWLDRALRDADIPPADATEDVLLQAGAGPWLRFEVPRVNLTAQALDAGDDTPPAPENPYA